MHATAPDMAPDMAHDMASISASFSPPGTMTTGTGKAAAALFIWPTRNYPCDDELR